MGQNNNTTKNILDKNTIKRFDSVCSHLTTFKKAQEIKDNLEKILQEENVYLTFTAAPPIKIAFAKSRKIFVEGLENVLAYYIKKTKISEPETEKRVFQKFEDSYISELVEGEMESNKGFYEKITDNEIVIKNLAYNFICTGTYIKIPEYRTSIADINVPDYSDYNIILKNLHKITPVAKGLGNVKKYINENFKFSMDINVIFDTLDCYVKKNIALLAQKDQSLNAQFYEGIKEKYKDTYSDEIIEKIIEGLSYKMILNNKSDWAIGQDVYQNLSEIIGDDENIISEIKTLEKEFA